MESATLKVLLIEDSPSDAVLTRKHLTDTMADQVEWVGVQRLAAGLEKLNENPFSIVLLDMGLPDCQGLETIHHVRNAAPEVPLVVLTISGDLELAEKTIQSGAQDYLVKGEFDADALSRSVRYALERQRVQNELTQRTKELEEALSNIRQLKSLLPICSYCKKIRDDQDDWHKLESYFHTHTDSKFSHDICPECMDKARQSIKNGNPKR